MSTTFEVYPTTAYIPRIAELLTLANDKLLSFLRPFDLKISPVIGARIGETFIDRSSSNSFCTQWKTEYAWFFITPDEHGGGTDAYYRIVEEHTLEIWNEYEDAGDRYGEVLKSLSVGHYWTFRRSAGQPAIINLCYGLLAAALAELTGGFIFSDDGAWSGPPIQATEFEARYFKPEISNNYGDASWYTQCLKSLIEDYQGIPYIPKVNLLIEHDWPKDKRVRYAPSGRTIQEGPDENDRLTIIHSEYVNFPYIIINRTLIKAHGKQLLRVLKLLLLKDGLRIGSQPVSMVHETDIKPMLIDRDFYSGLIRY
ncbi:hypothetical protein [Paenibacillus harenae]|uniref:DUF3396 domain-containing protein n=1 Tax=Paenibacillus harenae TaxID=306543 RepID=A0ABT9U697_PAEHA|nr:hypothetical protein [Paenibacillus harenae]MDQ0115155.1 hypothetical protein [Paenibacillus harenae]